MSEQDRVLLMDLLTRLTRVETRLCVLMLHCGLDPTAAQPKPPQSLSEGN